MSEGKRVSLQSIGPAKKDKKCKSTSTTIRLNLTLPTCNSANFADFNYNTLLLNEKRKKLKGKEKDDKVNGTATLDPYASDDEDDLRQIARSFESKYGTPKKKCSRLEDFTELGTGYDENDSFIDNTDAYDEVVPEDQTPEFDGFYINKGQLVLKRVDGRSSSDSSDEEDEGPQNSKSHKRQLSSESDSSNSDSSDDSDDSDESEESEEDEKNEEDVEMIDSPNEVNNGVKEDKSNGHITSPVAKKPKLSEVPSKKAKNKAITGLFLKKAVSEKEHNEKRLKLDLSDNEDNEKRLKQVSKDKEPNEKRVKLESEEMKHISHIDAAIEAVARGDDSKESGIAESKSHSGSSDESDAEEPKNAKLNGHSNNRRSNPPPLPADLPRSILNVIGALKEIANKNKNLGKQQFFNNEINKALLSFVKLMRTVPREKKGGVYDHLLFFLPCGKETLLKRGKALLAENVEAGYQEPLAQLKSGIDIAMPRAMERYRSMSIKYESDLTDHSKISPEKAKVPRRRFPWTEELRNLLCLAVKKRRIYYGTMKQKGERWDDHLREFLKKDVVTMWQTGWMKVGSLMEVIAKVDSDLLQFKLISPGIKKEALPGSSKKALIKNRYSTDDTVKYDAPAKRASSACSSSSSKPLLNITHQSLNNSVSIESSEAIAKKMQPLRNEGTAASSMTVAQPNIPTSASQSSSFDNYIDKEIVECIRTSLASNNVVSVTPVASPVFSVKLNNQKDNVSLECGSNTHNVPSSTALKSISNSVDIINLQANGLDATVESHPRKRPSFPSGNINPNGVHTFSAEDLSKPQTSSSLPTGTHCQPPHISSPHSSIKVSSVSAINLKLTASQPQQQAFQGQATSSKSAQSQPLKTNQQQTVSVSCNSSHQAVPLYNSHSVISHGLESSSLGSNASLTITPVKPTLSSSTYYQQTKASGHSSAPISSSQTVSYGSSSLRSEVIVTPSCNSGMPHIKSTNLNYSVSSTSSVSNSNNFSSPSMSGNNFSALPSNSGNNYSNSRNSSSINYLSSPGVSNNSFPLPNPEASVRTNRLLGNVNETQASKSPSDKASFAQPIRNSFPDKTLYMSPNMWQSSVPMDIQRSSSSSPSSLKSVTPSPEKAMVSRKDRILQDTRERTNSDPTMPTLSGPYQSANAMNEQSSVMRNQSQVLIASTESYKLTLPVLEPQRCDNVLSKSSPDLIRSKNSMGSTSSESQRVNVVMHTPLSHHSQKSNSVGYPQQSRDQTRSNTAMSNHAIHDVQRSNSSKMSSISDAQRANVVMPTPQLQESLRANSLKDEMSDILAGIPTQMISRTDHYTITNSMPGINTKKKASPGGSDLDIDITIGSSLPVASRVESKSVGKLPEDSLLTAQDLAMRGIVMSRANCDGSYVEETWSSQMKKNSSNKSSSDTPDQRLSGMGTLSSSLSMTGLDGMGLGLPSHLVGYQNDYQRHLYGGSSKSSGSNDHRPS